MQNNRRMTQPGELNWILACRIAEMRFIEAILARVASWIGWRS